MEKESIQVAVQFDENRFTKVNMIKTKRSVAFMLNFLPGQEMKPHNHPDRELYLYVVNGEGVLSINGEELKIRIGDVIRCGPEEQIGFINNSDHNVSMYATMTKLTE